MLAAIAKSGPAPMPEVEPNAEAVPQRRAFHTAGEGELRDGSGIAWPSPLFWVPGAEPHPEHSKLLAGLAMAIVREFGSETVVVDADNNILTGWRLARVGDFALLEEAGRQAVAKAYQCVSDCQR